MTRRGWCPTVFAPMPSGDGWLVRVKPPDSRLSVATAQVLADATMRFGNGVIELTSRANLQIRGLDQASAPGFAAAMVACGLASRDPALERRRNVIVSPLADDDPTISGDPLAVAREIVAGLAADSAFDALPAKFGFVVDGGGVLPLHGVPGDVHVRTAFEPSEQSSIPQNSRAIATTALSLARTAIAHPHAKTRNFSPVPRQIGFIPYDTTRGAFAFAPEFGQMNAPQLAAAAAIAAELGDGVLRITPWRTLAIGHVCTKDSARLAERMVDLGMIVDSADPRLRIAACAGKPACASASVETRHDARIFAQALPSGISLLHVSGCSKGCAHPAAAPVTLVGAAGRYAMVREGRAGDVPVANGLTLSEAAALLAEVA